MENVSAMAPLFGQNKNNSVLKFKPYIMSFQK